MLNPPPDKVLRDKAFNIAKNPKYDGYQRKLASMVYKLLIRNLLVLILQAVELKMRICQNRGLTKELHKPIIRNI